MKQKDQLLNIFRSEWVLICAEFCDQQQNWIPIRLYNTCIVIWEFEQVREFKLSDGGIAYQGRLKECLDDGSQHEMIYAYYPSDYLLYIDRSHREPDGFIDFCINERYLIDYICENNYWLYDMEDVSNAPFDYTFRMQIRRAE